MQPILFLKCGARSLVIVPLCRHGNCQPLGSSCLWKAAKKLVECIHERTSPSKFGQVDQKIVGHVMIGGCPGITYQYYVHGHKWSKSTVCMCVCVYVCMCMHLSAVAHKPTKHYSWVGPPALPHLCAPEES